MVIAVTNYFIDVEHVWRGNYYIDIKQSWSEDEVFIVPNVNFDERAFLGGLSRIVPPYDVLVLGSSRVFQVDSPMIGNRKLFNAAASTSVIQDYVSTWQIIKNNNRIPKYLILGIDPWAFNSNNGMNAWKTNSLYYGQFVDGRKTNFVTHSVPKKYWQLLSWRSFMQSIRWLLGKEQRVGVTKNIEFPIQFHAYRNDGSHIYSSGYLQQLTLDEVQSKAQNYASKCENILLCNWKVDELAYKQFIRMLLDAESQGVKVMLVLPPYQHEALRRMNANPVYAKALNEYQDLIQNKMYSSLKGFFKFCNGIDPVILGCEETDFVDGVHPQKECVEKLMKYCLTSTGFLQP